MQDKKTGKFTKTHGMRNTRFYSIWCAMKTRCKSKKPYLEKGIKVCNRWEKFENFKDDMHVNYTYHVKKYGEKDTTIDRIDNLKGYNKDNCKWKTWKEQFKNRNLYTKKCRECGLPTKSKWELCEYHYKKKWAEVGIDGIRA